jgi:hypothetical protein
MTEPSYLLVALGEPSCNMLGLLANILDIIWSVKSVFTVNLALKRWQAWLSSIQLLQLPPTQSFGSPTNILTEVAKLCLASPFHLTLPHIWTDCSLVAAPLKHSIELKPLLGSLKRHTLRSCKTWDFYWAWRHSWQWYPKGKIPWPPEDKQLPTLAKSI